MIIKETIKILDHTIYKNYSDKGVYIRNKENGTLWTTVNSSIDYEYEETDEPFTQETEQGEWYGKQFDCGTYGGGGGGAGSPSGGASGGQGGFTGFCIFPY